jgi:uncharacterized protein (DUF58 family)
MKTPTQRPDPMALTFGTAKNAEVLRRLDLTITRRLDGMLQGDYRGLVPGHGSELGETRGYQPGDDVRRIDWNVTARTQNVHVRESIADRELETWALVDLSPSLDFGTANYTKRELALIGLSAVGFITARTGNRLGAVIAGSAGPATVIPARGGRAHLMAVLHRALMRPKETEPGGTTDLGSAIARLAALHQRRGLAVVISDFLAPPGWDHALRRLSTRHETLAIEVVDPRELELPAVGVLALVDPETGRRREVQTSSAKLRARYAAAAADQRAEIAASIRGAGADHLQLRTDRDWVTDLVRFVALRRERAARLPRKAR